MNNSINYLRRERKLKQVDLAKALSVSPSYLCKIEKGLQPPTAEIMQKCSDFFGKAADEIFFEGENFAHEADNHVQLDGNTLWLFRMKKGIKQIELAGQLGCSPSYLSKIEKGVVQPTDFFKKQCAETLKVPEQELFA